MNELEIKEQMCDVCHKMWQLGWVAANDGNLSAKLGDGTYLATPTGISKSFITPEKIVRIDDEGKVLEGMEGYRPSSKSRCTCAAIRSATMWALWCMRIRRRRPATPWRMSISTVII